MVAQGKSDEIEINAKRMVELLNEDLSREYRAIIAYVVYSQVIKGAEYMNIADELEKHALQELQHAIMLAKQIDYLGGMPAVNALEVKTFEDSKDMLKEDLKNEQESVANYRKRIKQADAMSEFSLGEDLRKIIIQEQDHLIDLADALGIDAPRS